MMPKVSYWWYPAGCFGLGYTITDILLMIVR